MLSRRQHRQAVEDGDLFWLYVVENAQDDEYKIYRIQNPASRIDYFGFDGGWKDVAEPDVERDEAGTPTARVDAEPAEQIAGSIVEQTDAHRPVAARLSLFAEAGTSRHSSARSHLPHCSPQTGSRGRLFSRSESPASLIRARTAMSSGSSTSSRMVLPFSSRLSTSMRSARWPVSSS